MKGPLYGVMGVLNVSRAVTLATEAFGAYGTANVNGREHPTKLKPGVSHTIFDIFDEAEALL
jgi:hypothetical protein